MMGIVIVMISMTEQMILALVVGMRIAMRRPAFVILSARLR